MRRSCRHAGVAQRHLALHLDRAAHRVDDAGELDQQAVAGGLDDAAAMLGDLGVDQFAAERLQRRERAFLVRAHQPRVAGDIGRQDRRQPPLDPLSPRVHDGDASAIRSFTIAPGSVAAGRASPEANLPAVTDASDFSGLRFARTNASPWLPCQSVGR